MAHGSLDNAVIYPTAPSPMKWAFEIKTLYAFLGAAFFFLSLVIPTTNQGPRGIFLAILLLFGAVYYIMYQHVKMHVKVLYLFTISVTSSIFFILWGLMNDAPGALAVSTVYVIWPLVFAFLIGLTRDIRIYEALLKTVVIGAMISAMMGIGLVVDQIFGLGLNLQELLKGQGASVGISSGVVSYALYNVSTIVYAFPFIVSIFILGKETSIFRGWWKPICILALCLCALAILVSGRRALMLTSALSPFVAYAIAKVAGVRTRLGSLIVKFSPLAFIAAIFLVPRLGLDISTMTSNFMAGFQWSEDPDASIRAEQARVLLDGWMERPFLGHGLGASAGQVIRDDAQPWAYELTYLALLFQTGIIGIIIYVSLIFSIYYYSIGIIRKNKQAARYFIPPLTALACFLIANATNPYLGKFDYLWTIFLPVGLMNVFLLNRATGKTE